MHIRICKTLPMLPAHARAARALLNWTQAKLADEAGLGLSTVVDFERSRREVSREVIAAIRAAIERAGVELIDDAAGIGVRLRPRKRKRN